MIGDVLSSFDVMRGVFAAAAAADSDCSEIAAAAALLRAGMKSFVIISALMVPSWNEFRIKTDSSTKQIQRDMPFAHDHAHALVSKLGNTLTDYKGNLDANIVGFLLNCKHAALG